MSKLTTAASNRISFMKLICAFMVVVIHSQLANVNLVNHWVREFLMYGVCRVAVPFFFLSSGYFLARHVSDAPWWRSEVVKRIKGLLIPCITLNATFMLFVYAIRFSQGSFDPSIKSVLCDLGLDPCRTPMLAQLWYIRALLVLIGISPIVMAIMRRSSRLFAECALAVLMCGCFIVRPFSDCGTSIQYFFLNYGFSLEGLLYSSLGAFLFFHPLSVRPDRSFGFCSLVLGLLGFAARAYLLIHANAPEFANRIGFFAIPLVLFGLYRALPEFTLPKFLSTASYPVYLFHFIVLTLIGGRFIGSAGGVSVPDASLFRWFLRIVAAILVSLLATAAVRRYLPRFAAWMLGGR